MVANKIHDDLENRPNIQAFCATPKRPWQNTLSGVTTDAAIALVKVLGDTPQGGSETSTLCRQAVVSRGKAVDLQIKNHEQLPYIQELFHDGILSATLNRNKVFSRH